MFSKTKIALSVAIVLGTAIAASAATEHQAAHDNGSATYNMIPGYDKDGRTVGIPDPDKVAAQSKR
jgi:hypothetical protein